MEKLLYVFFSTFFLVFSLVTCVEDDLKTNPQTIDDDFVIPFIEILGDGGESLRECALNELNLDENYILTYGDVKKITNLSCTIGYGSHKLVGIGYFHNLESLGIYSDHPGADIDDIGHVFMPPEIKNLKNLKSLSIQTRNGYINHDGYLFPPEFDELNLESLTLYNVGSGRLFPPDVKMNSLKRLDIFISYPGFFAESEKISIPSGIEDLEGLEELRFSGIDTDGNSIAELLKKSGLRNLKILEANFITGGADTASISTLPPEIGNLKNLRELRLPFNIELKSIPKEIGNLTNLEVLDLNRCSINSVPKEIGMLTNLVELNLRGPGTNYGTSTLDVLPKEIANLTKLKKVDISFNDNLSGFKSDYGFCTVYEYYGTDSIIDDCDTPYDRTPITLADTNLQACVKDQLSLSENETLTKGHLHNMTTLGCLGSEVSSLEGIGLFKNLESLYIKTKLPLTSFPLEILELTKLTTLSISATSFSTFPNEILQLSSLTTLDFVFSSITSLPNGIGDLSNLKNLTLAFNQNLTGNLSDLGLCNIENIFYENTQLVNDCP